MMKKQNLSNQNKTALITGAASGIGYEISRFFANDGYNLVLIDRNEKVLLNVADKFQKQFSISVTTIIKDLSIPNSPIEVFRELQKKSLDIDVLVNNAGFGNYGFFTSTNLQSELEMLQVNLVCLTHLTKLFVQPMVKQGSGKILNVASAAAFQPGPLMAVYFATKAYVLSFSEAIANELQGTGVSVTALCPGPTESAFHQTTGMADTKLVKDKKMMDAATVAKIGYHGLMANKTVVIPGLQNRIQAEMVRFIPRNIVTKLVRFMQEQPV